MFMMAAVRADDLPLPFEAQLQRVIDGDSLQVIKSGGDVMELRLWGIDAPEFGAPWSRKSTAGLKRLLRGQPLLVTPVTFDRYDRLVVEVYAGEINAGLELVEQGLAWVYRRYNNRARYLAAAERAKLSGIGLWSDPAASSTPPWEWRRLNSTAGSDKQGCAESRAPVIGNRRSMIFHHRGCPGFIKVSCRNRVEFESAIQAQDEGFRAARNCTQPH